MTAEEVIKTIQVAIAEVEWEYPLDYSIAFETAIEALEKQIPKKPRYVDTRFLSKIICQQLAKNMVDKTILIM